MKDMTGFEMAYTVLGGLGLFFLGMKYLSESLQAIAGDLIRKVINWLTTNRILAVMVGTLVTCIVQSSSVTTVMVVGMVNAGLMNLAQALGVIFGANIGTTITGWIIAIKVGKFGLLFIAVGIFPMFFTKNDNWKATGKLLVALGLVFYGLDRMSFGFSPLRHDTGFKSALHLFDANSFISLLGCILVGTLTTAIVQSSSAMLGITIAMAMSGVISFQTSMGIVIGLNIGTTITAILASIGTNANAKRAALAHVFFNIFGALFMSIIFWQYVHFIDWIVPQDPDHVITAAQGASVAAEMIGTKPYIAQHIAMGHTIFNVLITLLFMFFLQPLARFVTWLVPADPKEKSRLKFLPTTGIAPALGLEQAEKEVDRMLDDLRVLIVKTQQYTQLEKDNPKILDDIVASEDLFDLEQKDLTVFVCNVMESPLTPEQSALGYSLIRASDEIESVSDYCAILARTYKKTLVYKDRRLNMSARQEFTELLDATLKYYDQVLDFARNRNTNVLHDLDLMSRQLTKHADRVRGQHLNSIKTGESTALAGLVFQDMIRTARRIKSHTNNIVDAILSSVGENREVA